MKSTAQHRPSEGSLWGTFAFTGVVFASYSQFLLVNRFYGEPWRVIPTFVLGIIYMVLGVASTRWVEPDGPVRRGMYFGGQAVLVAALLFLSPIRGFFGILVLPLASQAVFLFPWWGALLASAALYVLTVSVFWIPWGWSSAVEAFSSYAPAFLFTVTFSFATRSALDARERSEKLRTELQEANAQLRDQAKQAQELATTRERNRLSREIHDGLGHYLTVINVQLEAARSVFERDPAKARGALDQAARLSREALEEIRASVSNLRTDGSREPLPVLLKRLLADAALPVTLEVLGEARALPSNIEHALFRAAQEGLTNVRKHAAATEVRVLLDYRDAAGVSLAVNDNGCGVHAGAGSGFGLNGLRERIQLLQGEVRSGPGESGGFRLEVSVPAVAP